MERIELIKNFERDCKLRDLADGTIKEYLSEVRIFSRFLEYKENGVNIMNVDKEILQDFLKYLKQERKLSVKRMENYFSGLNAFYEFLKFEEIIDVKPPIVEVRKRYIRRYKKNSETSQRKLISIKEMAMLINSILDIRDKAIAVLLAKTGIRRKELVGIDVDDIDWDDGSIKLKKTAKRSNKIVFFDNETGMILKRWLKRRDKLVKDGCRALFVGNGGSRLKRSGIYNSIVAHAERIGLHDPNSHNLEDHFTPHCCRHWFTTHLRRAGMPREFIQELRGDIRKDAIDIYDHIDKEELKKSYLGCIPLLGLI